MNTKLIMAGVLAALSLSLGGVALADDEGDRGGDTMREKAPTEAWDIRDFQALDTDHDGYISAVEAKTASFKNRFNQLDANGDGKLSFDELDNTVAMRK